MLRGIVEGALAALCFLYGLQTRIMYPAWLLATLDEPWIALVAVIVAVLSWSWSPKASVYILLLVIAFAADVYVFAKAPTLGRADTISDSKTYDRPLATDSRVSKKAMDYWDGWFGANGDVWFFDPLSEENGPAKVPLAEPKYPLYTGLHEPSRGPAPFIPAPNVEK